LVLADAATLVPRSVAAFQYDSIASKPRPPL
jgi:hypothetical protein